MDKKEKKTDLQRNKFLLQLKGGQTFKPEKNNCTTATFSLTNVRDPNPTLFCKLQGSAITHIICGLDLRAGFPPDKPSDISCETTRHSDQVTCTWASGRETHLSTTYTVTVKSRRSGAPVYHKGIQSAGEFHIPRTALNESEEHDLTMTARNDLGEATSDPFILSVKNIVIPDTPQILYVEFRNDSASKVHWNSSNLSEHLRPRFRVRSRNGSWVEGEETGDTQGLVTMDHLEALTNYEVQVRLCNSSYKPVSSTRPSTIPRTTNRTLCSRWSPSFLGKTPGKGPTRQLDVWRLIHDSEVKGFQNVTVLWKALSAHEYSGRLQRYELLADSAPAQEVCLPDVSHCSILVPDQVKALSVSAATLYGKSPPAVVHIQHTGLCSLMLSNLTPVGNNNTVSLNWSWPFGPGPEVLIGYVVQWTSGPHNINWKRVGKKLNATLISGLPVGVRYNVSLYAETYSGLCYPRSGLAYSREEKPVSGPRVTVLAHEAWRIQIQWEDLPIDQRRGFITNYTIYIKSLNSGTNPKVQSLTLPASGPRQRWLDCPEGPLALWLAASTSAGEGPKGNLVSSRPAGPPAKMIAGLAPIAAILILIFANLVGWRCVRERIKLLCVALGPGWLSDDVPRPGNSNAILLLKQKMLAADLTMLSTPSDPPMTSIEEFEDLLYPIIHHQTPKDEPTPRATSEPDPADSPLDCGYKPQTACTIAASLLEQDADNEPKKRPQGDEWCAMGGGPLSDVSGGLLGVWHPGGKEDLSGSSPDLTLGLMDGFLPSSASLMASISFGDQWHGGKGAECEF